MKPHYNIILHQHHIIQMSGERGEICESTLTTHCEHLQIYFNVTYFKGPANNQVITFNAGLIIKMDDI